MKFLGFLLLLVVIGAGVAGFLVLAPYGPSTETFVDIAVGTSTRGMGQKLAAAGVIRSEYAFDLVRVVKRGRLKAGEYRFDHPATAVEVYERIARGDVYTRAVTVPEGYNLWDIAAAVETAGLGKQADFLKAAKANTKLIAQWSPAATSMEGYLFPDTYRFSRHTTDEQMLAAMVRRFGRAMAELGVTGNVSRMVTMASLVEKEVHIDSERPMVAGVFENRLRVGMPLATDPAVAYAAMLDGRWRGTIYASDLANLNPYNTYRHAGLPPGPICSPGMAALRAALHPMQTDNLYFVADAAGHTRFSATLQEHAAQVQAYRKATR
ncbi:endolytic transglycosylase MltG [Terriglobus saanensis]|uniref:Endolytic murein transglycosylase n=1 Tax=Terriglobus saanensis (strain ATCC BAA-1853 / DSM 23119 / SP1PR4) TaxID=401053 RepID=E8V3R9_TERSS|nr:endolytic transglycosylase MltG [Terriglobus saanensis]ADV84756.1 aminodeoxychorismate lyase [Terriglobus saanensis SP1PR4]